MSYPHQETIADNKIDISKLSAKLQTKITKFNELEKKKFRTEEEEEELAEKDEVIFNDLMDWLEEHEPEGEKGENDEPEGKPTPVPAPATPKASPKAASPAPVTVEELVDEGTTEGEFATAPTATPKAVKAPPTPPKPKEKKWNVTLGIAE